MLPSQVKWFISETPVGVHERTSIKEHLVRHGSKHKIQVHTTKRNKRQQKQNRTHFQNKKQPETRERSLTKTKARGKNENRWVQQTYTLTYKDHSEKLISLHWPDFFLSIAALCVTWEELTDEDSPYTCTIVPLMRCHHRRRTPYLLFT